MADIGSGIPDRKPNFLKHRMLRRRRRLQSARTGNDGRALTVDLRCDAFPLAAQRRLDVAWLPSSAVGTNRLDPRMRARAAPFGVLAALDHDVCIQADANDELAEQRSHRHTAAIALGE